MQARELMTGTIHCCTPTTPIQNAARLMKERDIGALPIVESEDRRKAVGILTDRDIVIRLVAEGMNPLECACEDAMTAQTFSVKADDSEEEVCHVMEDHQIRRVLVVNENDICIGIISQADIARKTSEHETAELVKDVSRPTMAA
ncbi:MAG: CBS domain-containing protein [Phycisphaeraceae bacterium]